MGTVRMQFDHEEEDEDFGNRADNSGVPAGALAAELEDAPSDVEEYDALSVTDGEDSVLRDTVIVTNGQMPMIGNGSSSHHSSSDEYLNWKRGTDWIHALEAGNFIDRKDRDDYRDISSKATWTLSSCKVDGDGFGINELLSNNPDSYWQSDGPQPHTITVEFPRKTDISFLALYLDYKSDESYTPNKICVRLGASLMHLDDEFEQAFHEPCGWQIMDLRRGSHAKRAWVLQLQVVANHQNGRDTHIRHMRVIGPVRSRYHTVARALVTPQLVVCEQDNGPADENGDPTVLEDAHNSARNPREAPLMPILSVAGKFKSMIIR